MISGSGLPASARASPVPARPAPATAAPPRKRRRLSASGFAGEVMPRLLVWRSSSGRWPGQSLERVLRRGWREQALPPLAVGRVGWGAVPLGESWKKVQALLSRPPSLTWGAVPLGQRWKKVQALLSRPPSLTLPHRKRGEGDAPLRQAGAP
ncbi:hypothetical protein BOSE29B_30328 [Bosea sp. 29B]|nr:hypothetical protein BOSE29B_30328 [Bosea sp. 29B]